MPHAPLILTVGDLVEDVVVRVAGPVEPAADTPASITRHRGGSAANVAVAVARAGGRARFVGRVGADDRGSTLVAALRTSGVEVICETGPADGPSTGTIVVIVDRSAERSFLTDRGACVDLDGPDPAWLTGVDAVHLPAYSFIGGRIAETSRRLCEQAVERGLPVSVDASSTSVLRDLGPGRFFSALTELGVGLLFANEAEAAMLSTVEGWPDNGAMLVVVKQGAAPTIVHRPGLGSVAVPVPAIEGVLDTTGAGDAFAAGFLLATLGGHGPEAAAAVAHLQASRVVTVVGAGGPEPAGPGDPADPPDGPAGRMLKGRRLP